MLTSESCSVALMISIRESSSLVCWPKIEKGQHRNNRMPKKTLGFDILIQCKYLISQSQPIKSMSHYFGVVLTGDPSFFLPAQSQGEISSYANKCQVWLCSFAMQAITKQKEHSRGQRLRDTRVRKFRAKQFQVCPQVN